MEHTNKRDQARVARLVTATIAVALTLTLAAAILPAVAAQAATPEATFRSRIAAGEPSVKFTPIAAPEVSVARTERTATYIAPPAPAASRSTSRRSTSSGSATGTSSGSGDAQAILARYIAKYPILAGTTVSYGDAKGAQAIAYYKSGRIVISPNHTASLERIIGHEIWHIIDWRDNGVIDWGENVPPK